MWEKKLSQVHIRFDFNKCVNDKLRYSQVCPDSSQIKGRICIEECKVKGWEGVKNGEKVAHP